jgi:hypothetical protein
MDHAMRTSRSAETIDRVLCIVAQSRQGELSQNDYHAHCATRLTQTGESYWRLLSRLPAGYRISALEELVPLIRHEEGRHLPGWNPKQALADRLFDDLIRSRPWLWEWTLVSLRAPRGARELRYYRETDGLGTVSFRADYLIGETVVAEGIRVPASRGAKVVEWDEILRLPRRVSEGKEPAHTSHFYLDESQQEVGLLLCGDEYADEEGACLNILGTYGRSIVADQCAFRLFLGSIEEVPLPHQKERESSASLDGVA